MSSLLPPTNGLWSVVLAGGDGERTRPFITRWLGHAKPKQYCTFSGERSLFQQTLDRTERLTPPSHRVTVAAVWHRDEMARQLAGREPGRVVFQPANRGTAPGIFLPLSFVHAADPEATVVFFPSDHFVHPELRMTEAIRKAVRAVELLPERVVLLGAAPDRLEPDYGWIEPGPASASESLLGLRSVRRFVEKPGVEEASALLVRGGLWYTFVTVAKVATLWDLGRQCLPAVMELFDRFMLRAGSSTEERELLRLYRAMPARDFSADLLQQVPSRLAVLEMSGVTWSDWGRPERILETLERMGLSPAFPTETLIGV